MSQDMDRAQRERDEIQRAFTAAEAVEFIQAAQVHLAGSYGFDATLDTLDQAISEIRQVTGAPEGEADDEEDED